MVSALPVATDRITQDVLELRPIEGALTGIQFICQSGSLNGTLQRSLGFVPNSVLADTLIGTIGEFDSNILEAEIAIDGKHLFVELHALFRNLIFSTEDMRIILSEVADP